MKNRFQILKHISVGLSTAYDAVTACCILHNICSDNRAEQLAVGYDYTLLRDDFVLFKPDGIHDGGNGCDLRNTARRDEMASAYYNHNIHGVPLSYHLGVQE